MIQIIAFYYTLTNRYSTMCFSISPIPIRELKASPFASDSTKYLNYLHNYMPSQSLQNNDSPTFFFFSYGKFLKQLF